MKRAAPPEVLVRTEHGRSLLFSLDAGEGVPEHTHPGQTVVLAVLAGRVDVTRDSAASLNAGEVITHDGAQPLSMMAAQAGTRVLVTLLGPAGKG